MTVAVVVPVLRRPHRIEPFLASLAEATPEPHEVVFMCTVGDQAEIEAVEAAGAQHVDIEHHPGDYARKVNVAYAATSHDLLFLAADDLQFHDGWLTAAKSKMFGPVGVVGTNDLGSARVMAGRHATHSLVSRAYVDEFGTIDEPRKVLYEGYEHEYVDDELVGTARKRGAWSFAADSHVEHLHPDYGKAPMDALYAAQRDRMKASRRLYERRRRLWT